MKNISTFFRKRPFEQDAAKTSGTRTTTARLEAALGKTISHRQITINTTCLSDNTMSLVFAGARTAFRYQHFKMVDMLINHFEHNVCGLNPHTAPHVPRAEGNKVETKEEGQEPKRKRTNKLSDGDDFGWKIPSKKNISKHNAHMGDFQPCVGDNKKFSTFEDTDGEDDCSVDAESSADEVFQEPKIRHGVETLSAKDADDKINQPEGK